MQEYHPSITNKPHYKQKINNATFSNFITEKPRRGTGEYNRIIQKTVKTGNLKPPLNKESEKQSNGTSKTTNCGDTKNTNGRGDTNDHTTRHPPGVGGSNKRETYQIT